MTDNDKMLIHIPKGGQYIEILGHRIDGFDSFEAFCEYLKKCADMEDTINRQKAEIDDLKRDTVPKLQYGLQRANKYGKELDEIVICQKAEIERLNGILDSYALQYGTATDKEVFLKQAKADGAKELAEGLKETAMGKVAWD